MQNELQVIADILVVLEKAVVSDAARHNSLLLLVWTAPDGIKRARMRSL
jgi:hypothetical protein